MNLEMNSEIVIDALGGGNRAKLEINLEAVFE